MPVTSTRAALRRRRVEVALAVRLDDAVARLWRTSVVAALAAGRPRAASPRVARARRRGRARAAGRRSPRRPRAGGPAQAPEGGVLELGAPAPGRGTRQRPPRLPARAARPGSSRPRPCPTATAGRAAARRGGAARRRACARGGPSGRSGRERSRSRDGGRGAAGTGPPGRSSTTTSAGRAANSSTWSKRPRQLKVVPHTASTRTRASTVGSASSSSATGRCTGTRWPSTPRTISVPLSPWRTRARSRRLHAAAVVEPRGEPGRSRHAARRGASLGRAASPPGRRTSAASPPGPVKPWTRTPARRPRPAAMRAACT